jgi:phosphoribosyl 1,2-cyclic phosphodiesterase
LSPPARASDLFVAPAGTFEFASLGSGSRGNATVVRGPDGCLLIDCGFSLRTTVERLALLGLAPSDVRGVLVTHEHSDHVNGVARFARAHGMPVFTTVGTARQVDLAGCEVVHISARRAFVVAGLEVQPVVVPHDAREPVQFVLGDGASRLGVLTDAGHVTPHMIDAYDGVDALMLECNHDPDMLYQGRYPEPLKRRVGGPHGHLSNEQALGFLRAVGSSRLRRLVLAHLSEQNNQPAMAEGVIRTGIEDHAGISPEIGLADQATGYGWTPVARAGTSEVA